MLIQLVSIHPSHSPQSIHLACAFLKAYALKSAASIDLVDFFLNQDNTLFSEQLIASSPTAIGFSMYVWNREICCEIAKRIRRSNPDIMIFCGGPEVTAMPKTVLDTGFFDCAIIGEGEVPFLGLCNALADGTDYSAIPGVMLPAEHLYSASSPLMNLDDIPSPYLTGIIDTHSNSGILWQLSRGCSFTCDFCFDARGINGVRLFTLQRVESELKHLSASSVSQVFVLDSTFNCDKVRAKTILKMIKKYAPDIHFHFEVRSEFIDREMADLFAQISCSLQIGLQSSDKDVLSLVGRKFDPSDFTAKVGLLNRSGAVFGFDLIYGLPGDSLNGYLRSLDYALSLYPNHLDIFPLAVLPGTRLASRGHQLLLQWNSHPPYLVESSKDFSTADMAFAAETASACDIFYTRGKAVAWFNAVVAALSVRPSELLQRFSRWLIAVYGKGAKESDYSDEDIFTMQLQFLSIEFNSKSLKRYLPLVHDLVTYHHMYAAVLLAPVDSAAIFQLPPINSISGLRLASSALTASFSYDIEMLLDCGEPRIAWMYRNLPKMPSRAVIYSSKGVVRTELLDEPYFALLEQIAGHGMIINKAHTNLSSSEISDFLIFASEEGIVVGSGE